MTSGIDWLTGNSIRMEWLSIHYFHLSMIAIAWCLMKQFRWASLNNLSLMRSSNATQVQENSKQKRGREKTTPSDVPFECFLHLHVEYSFPVSLLSLDMCRNFDKPTTCMWWGHKSFQRSSAPPPVPFIRLPIDVLTSFNSSRDNRLPAWLSSSVDLQSPLLGISACRSSSNSTSLSSRLLMKPVLFVITSRLESSLSSTPNANLLLLLLLLLVCTFPLNKCCCCCCWEVVSDLWKKEE